MYDLLFAIALSAFLLIEGTMNESETIFPFRMILAFILVPLSAIMVVIEFIFWGGDNVLILIIAIASLIGIISFLIIARLGR